MAERERPLHELLSRDMVDIYVGTENTHWILHAKLLCHRSKHFRNIFYDKKGNTKQTTYGLPDDDDEPFRMFVGWLYSASLPQPTEEKDLSLLLDLYLMAEKWEIRALTVDVLETVRKWYHDTDSWPGLRRVQYIYANTEAESPMRQLLVSCVARMLITGDSMPQHWEKALRKNGQLAVDIIMCVQKWHIEPESVPDTRHSSMASVVDEAEMKREYKQEGVGINGMQNGANGDGEHSEEDATTDGGEETAQEA